jgi:hypothetical protein
LDLKPQASSARCKQDLALFLKEVMANKARLQAHANWHHLKDAVGSEGRVLSRLVASRARQHSAVDDAGGQDSMRARQHSLLGEKGGKLAAKGGKKEQAPLSPDKELEGVWKLFKDYKVSEPDGLAKAQQYLERKQRPDKEVVKWVNEDTGKGPPGARKDLIDKYESVLRRRELVRYLVNHVSFSTFFFSKRVFKNTHF